MKNLYNLNELRHIAVNYAVTCLQSSDGWDIVFDDWLKNINPNWRHIANQKNIRVKLNKDKSSNSKSFEDELSNIGPEDLYAAGNKLIDIADKDIKAAMNEIYKD